MYILNYLSFKFKFYLNHNLVKKKIKKICCVCNCNKKRIKYYLLFKFHKIILLNK